jgi:pyruvate kinase
MAAAAAAGEMVRGFVAATRVARPAAAVAALPQPRRAVAARVLRTAASEKVAADLSVVGTNGSLSALVSVRAGSPSLSPSLALP